MLSHEIRRRLSFVLPVLILLSLGICLYPRLMSFLHQLRAGRQLVRIQLRLNDEFADPATCAHPAFEDQHVRDLVNLAKIHALTAISYDPNAAHSHLLLGRADCLRGQYQAATEAFRTFTELRPGNPLGHLELGFAYQALCANRAIPSTSETTTGTGDPSTRQTCPDPSLRAKVQEEWQRAGITTQQLLDQNLELMREMAYERAISWYRRAELFESAPFDTLPEDSGSQIVIFESFTNLGGWEACSWCENTSGRIELEQGILEMSFTNDKDLRQRFAYRNLIRLPIEDFSQLSLRVRGKLGSRLTIEVVIDDQRERPRNFEPLSESWQIWTIPIEGNQLREIMLRIDEQESTSLPDQYEVFFDWIGIQ